MASARIQAKSGTVEGKENSTTILKEREMAYIYPDEIGKGNVKLICGDGNTEIKDLPYVGGDDAADMQVSEIEEEPAETEITSGMKFPKLFGIVKKLISSLQSKEQELDSLIATAQSQIEANAEAISTNQTAIKQINNDLSDLQTDISSLSEIKMVRSITIGSSVSVLDLYNSMPALTIKWWYCNGGDVTDLPVSGNNFYVMMIRYTETYGSMYAYRMGAGTIYFSSISTVNWSQVY